jgi:hypothetical protein
MNLEKMLSDPETRAKLLKWGWLISLIMLVLGYVLMVVFWDA